MFDGKKFFPYLVFCGQVWPLNFVWACVGRFYFYRDWPLVALNPYRYAVYIMDVSYFVSSGLEVNMSCLLIFNFVETFNQLVCS